MMLVPFELTDELLVSMMLVPFKLTDELLVDAMLDIF